MPVFISTADATDAWRRFLLDDLDNQLAIATSEDLPVDAGIMGVAHVLHGINLATGVGEHPADIVAAWLRLVADCLDHDIDPPLLVWGVVADGADDERLH